MLSHLSHQSAINRNTGLSMLVKGLYVETLDDHAAMNGYKAFYRGKEIEVYAKTSYAAQVKAAKHFKDRMAEAVTVVLFEENVLVDGCENLIRHGKQVIDQDND